MYKYVAYYLAIVAITVYVTTLIFDYDKSNDINTRTAKTTETIDQYASLISRSVITEFTQPKQQSDRIKLEIETTTTSKASFQTTSPLRQPNQDFRWLFIHYHKTGHDLTRAILNAIGNYLNETVSDNAGPRRNSWIPPPPSKLSSSLGDSKGTGSTSSSTISSSNINTNINVQQVFPYFQSHINVQGGAEMSSFDWNDYLEVSYPTYKIIHFVRDPYDYIISAYLYHSQSSPPPERFITNLKYNPCQASFNILIPRYVNQLQRAGENATYIFQLLNQIESICQQRRKQSLTYANKSKLSFQQSLRILSSPPAQYLDNSHHHHYQQQSQPITLTSNPAIVSLNITNTTNITTTSTSSSHPQYNSASPPASSLSPFQVHHALQLEAARAMIAYEIDAGGDLLRMAANSIREREASTFILRRAVGINDDGVTTTKNETTNSSHNSTTTNTRSSNNSSHKPPPKQKQYQQRHTKRVNLSHDFPSHNITRWKATIKSMVLFLLDSETNTKLVDIANDPIKLNELLESIYDTAFVSQQNNVSKIKIADGNGGGAVRSSLSSTGTQNSIRSNHDSSILSSSISVNNINKNNDNENIKNDNKHDNNSTPIYFHATKRLINAETRRMYKRHLKADPVYGPMLDILAKIISSSVSSL